MRPLYLRGKIPLAGAGEQRISCALYEEHHRRQRRMMVRLFGDAGFTGVQFYD